MLDSGHFAVEDRLDEIAGQIQRYYEAKVSGSHALSRLDPVGERRMRVLSVNVGLPRQVSWKGQSVTTGIFKEPVDVPSASAR